MHNDIATVCKLNAAQRWRTRQHLVMRIGTVCRNGIAIVTSENERSFGERTRETRQSTRRGITVREVAACP
jgi:hypothetical protein